MAARDPQISCRVRSPATARDVSGMWRTPAAVRFEAAQGRRISVPNRRCRTFERVPAPKAGRCRRKSEGERRYGTRAQTFGDGAHGRSFRRRMRRNDAPQTFDRAWCGPYNFTCPPHGRRMRVPGPGGRHGRSRRHPGPASFRPCADVGRRCRRLGQPGPPWPAFGLDDRSTTPARGPSRSRPIRPPRPRTLPRSWQRPDTRAPALRAWPYSLRAAPRRRQGRPGSAPGAYLRPRFSP